MMPQATITKIGLNLNFLKQKKAKMKITIEVILMPYIMTSPVLIAVISIAIPADAIRATTAGLRHDKIESRPLALLYLR